MSYVIPSLDKQFERASKKFKQQAPALKASDASQDDEQKNQPGSPGPQAQTEQKAQSGSLQDRATTLIEAIGTLESEPLRNALDTLTGDEATNRSLLLDLIELTIEKFEIPQAYYTSGLRQSWDDYRAKKERILLLLLQKVTGDELNWQAGVVLGEAKGDASDQMSTPKTPALMYMAERYIELNDIDPKNPEKPKNPQNAAWIAAYGHRYRALMTRLFDAYLPREKQEQKKKPEEEKEKKSEDQGESFSSQAFKLLKQPNNTYYLSLSRALHAASIFSSHAPLVHRVGSVNHSDHALFDGAVELLWSLPEEKDLEKRKALIECIIAPLENAKKAEANKFLTQLKIELEACVLGAEINKPKLRKYVAVVDALYNDFTAMEVSAHRDENQWKQNYDEFMRRAALLPDSRWIKKNYCRFGVAGLIVVAPPLVAYFASSQVSNLTLGETWSLVVGVFSLSLAAAKLVDRYFENRKSFAVPLTRYGHGLFHQLRIPHPNAGNVGMGERMNNGMGVVLGAAKVTT